MNTPSTRPTLTLNLQTPDDEGGRLLSPSEVSNDQHTPARRTLSFLPSPRSPKEQGDEEGGLNASRRKSKEAKAPVARGKFECRKLLSHLLDSTKRSADRVVWYATQERTSPTYGDDEDESRSSKSKEGQVISEIFELVVQLRDVLIFSDRQGWNLFFTSDASFDTIEHSPPGLHLPRNRFFATTPPASPSSPSANAPGSRYSGSTLLDSALALLEHLVLLAGKHTISRFGPASPPLALQSATLDIAFILHRAVSGRLREVVAVGQAVLAGLEGWGPAVKARLLTFYENLLSDCLESASRYRGKLAGRGGGDDEMAAGSNVRAAPAIQVDAPTETLEVPTRAAKRSLDVRDRGWTTTASANESATMYQLSSLVAPILAAMLDTFNPSSSPLLLLHRHHQLIETAVKLKDDFYNDLLEIVAHGTSSMRQGALILLSTYWPQAIGHAHATPPFRRARYTDDAIRSQGQELPPPSAIQQHLYLPWAFAGDSEDPSLRCAQCGEAIRGFGLICVAGAHAPLHLHCYSSPSGCDIVHLSTSTGIKVAAARFSTLHQHRRCVVLTSTTMSEAERAKLATALFIREHPFRLCNLFTLTVCFICRKTLWGTIKQAFRCEVCHRFAHRGCVLGRAVPPCMSSEERPVEEVSIDWLAMRKDWLAYFGGMVLSEEQLASTSHEEMAVFYSVLWTQLQILEAGVASGTIVVANAPTTSEFELHALVVKYGEVLLSRRLRRSAALIDFDTAVGEDGANRILFSWDLLAYISTSIRSPVIASESSSGLLAVSHSAPETNTEQCFEVMQVSLMKDILARDFDLRSDLASRWLLDWILATRHFFERVDGHISLFDSPSTTLCSFPFPLLVDPALTVETLIVAIEQCLREPDLSLQEAGFLLLARRCRPTVFSSRYALDRLAMAVIGWLVTEEALFAAAIGGARSKRQKEVSGAAYQAIRSQITATYATRWLWKLHSLDPDAYAETLFDSLAALAVETEAATDSKEVKEERKAIFSDLLVRYMSRLAGSGALYSAFDLLFAQWLDECVEQQVRSRSEVQPLVLRSVVRLCRGGDAVASTALAKGRSFSVNKIEPDETRDATANADLNPWRVVSEAMYGDRAGLERGVNWLGVLAEAGVDIPVVYLETAFALACKLEAPPESFASLASTLFMASWSRSHDADSLASLAGRLLASRQEFFVGAVGDARTGSSALIIIRYALLAFVLASGAALEELESKGLLEASEMRSIVQRRRRGSRYLGVMSDASISKGLMATLKRFVACDSFALRALVCKALFVVLAGSSACANAEDLILLHADSLASCIYRAFDPMQDGLASTRMKLLVKLLIVAPEAFTHLLDALARIELWEARWTALEAVFQIVVESVEAASSKEVLEHLTPAVIFLFSALWDAEEPNRQKANVLVDSLQPTHLAVISNILQAHFEAVGIEEKIEICAFLLQLRGRLPRWQAFPWWHLTGRLFDLDDVEKKHIRHQAEQLRLSLASLGLSYIAAGLDVSARDTQFIKYHTAKSMGFEATLAPTGLEGETGVIMRSLELNIDAGARFGCLFDLKRVLDCARPLNRRDIVQQEGVPDSATPLVGLDFADLVLRLFSADLSLPSLPPLHLRALLDCLRIVVFKHDITSRPDLSELLVAALKRTVELIVADDIAHEIRLVVISVLLCALRRYPSLVIPLLGQQISCCLAMMAKQLDDRGAEFSQARTFLQAAFAKYGASGLFVLVFKILPPPAAPGDQGHRLFEALKVVMLDGGDVMDETKHVHRMRDLPILDVSQALLSGNNKHEVISAVVTNMTAYVKHCHGGPFDAHVVEALSTFLARFSRSVTDWRWDEIDLCALLDVASAAVKTTVPTPSALIGSIDLFLRASMGRFPFSKDSLSTLLSSLGDILRPHRSDSDSRQHSHGHIGSTCLYFLEDGLAGRPLPLITMTALLELKPVRFARIVLPEAKSAVDLAPPIRRFMLSRPGDERLTRHGFGAWQAAAKLFLGLARREQEVWSTLQTLHGLDSVRVINLLSLACLDLEEHALARSLLSNASERIGIALAGSQSIVEDGGEVIAQLAAHIQTTVLLIRLAHPKDEQERTRIETSWWVGAGGTWSALEHLLETAEPADDGSLTPLKTVVWSTAADLFLFLHRAESSLVTTETAIWSSWLRTLILRPQDSTSMKVIRALDAMSGEMSTPANKEQLLAQARTDTYAAFKLRVWPEARR